MSIKKVEAKTILQKTGIPGFGYAINPYTGCIHGCVYCYARFMKRFTGHTEQWGLFLDAKVNAPEVLRKQLKRKKEPIRKSVFLSSVTDAYQPAESIFKLTRGVLEVLLEYQVPIAILTKSDLVLRDIDLLREFEECSVGLSLMTVDEVLARHFEPYAPSPMRRVHALRELKQNNICTYAFISPYLPHFSHLESLIEALDGLIEEIGIEALNTKDAYWRGVKNVLDEFYPGILFGYRSLCTKNSYWDSLERKATHLASQCHISFMGVYRH